MSAPSFVNKDFPLQGLNSWKVGGRAQFYICSDQLSEMIEAIVWAQKMGLEITSLGDGTNCLISDKGVPGLVISTQNYKGIESQRLDETDQRFRVIAKSGTSKMDLMRVFMKQKLSPALFLSGLPGNLGGGIAMNAGVREDRSPREFNEIVDWIEVLCFSEAPTIQRFKSSEIQWDYRHSHGWQPGLILKAQLSWAYEPSNDIPKKVLEANKLRLSKQPLDLPSCGSTFKNPVGQSAGQLIEQAGLKGYKVGGAEVSTKHANFIVNTGGAKALDIQLIIEHIQKTVKKSSGIDLVTEVKMIGDWG